MKRTLIILAGLIIFFNGLSANDDFKKEKKALVETIKKEYVTWLERDYQEWLTANSSTFPSADSTNKFLDSFSKVNDQLSTLVMAYVPEKVVSANKLKDFKFSILKDQAVVKFKADDDMKSAFLEKKDGDWKLICVANLRPPL
jgi:hypothetical protein